MWPTNINKQYLHIMYIYMQTIYCCCIYIYIVLDVWLVMIYIYIYIHISLFNEQSNGCVWELGNIPSNKWISNENMLVCKRRGLEFGNLFWYKTMYIIYILYIYIYTLYIYIHYIEPKTDTNRFHEQFTEVNCRDPGNVMASQRHGTTRWNYLCRRHMPPVTNIAMEHPNL